MVRAVLDDVEKGIRKNNSMFISSFETTSLFRNKHQIERDLLSLSHQLSLCTLRREMEWKTFERNLYDMKQKEISYHIVSFHPATYC